MLHEKSCGAIVYRRFHGNIEILLIKHVNSGHWSFPKGHVEENETEEDAADRLYDLLFDCLCRVTPTDFTIIQTSEVES